MAGLGFSSPARRNASERESEPLFWLLQPNPPGASLQAEREAEDAGGGGDGGWGETEA